MVFIQRVPVPLPAGVPAGVLRGQGLWRSYVIVLGSYLFYAWWRPDFLLLFVAISYWNPGSAC